MKRERRTRILASEKTESDAVKLAREGRLNTETTEPLWRQACSKLRTGERPPFRQVTFTLHDDQWAVVQKAVKRAIQQPDKSSKNANRNGNAIYRICRQWLRGLADERQKSGRRADRKV